MSTREILGRIMISPESTIRQAMQAIDLGAAGIAVIIDDKTHLLGTVTDGDIRRALLRGNILDDPVAPIMNIQCTTVTPHIGRAEVLDIMRARDLKQIPIINENGVLQGLHLMHEIVGAGERPNWAVIMAGGRGERLRPLTDHVPKPLIKVAGRSILERIILHLVGFGIRQIFISINYLAEMIEEHLGDGSAYGCRIEYIHEKKPLGTGGPLSLLPDQPDHPLLIMNGDLLTLFDLNHMFSFHEENGYLATLGVHNHIYTVPYGVVFTENNRVRQISEKPSEVWLINAGVYILEPGLLARIPPNTYYPLPSLIEECLERNENVGAFEIKEEWYDIGHHQQLKMAQGKDEHS
ncbi:nucleotidyltransferase family protein [bacterium]|nr:nucleotidyltransferase family protein [bacterium]